MTDASLPTSAPAGSSRRDRFWHRIDPWLEKLGEKCNPILVKEARQSLKSRQFLITFGLVLAAGWIWSLLGVALMSPSIFHAERGPEMLTGYYWILGFPLFVIVPFSAFRSLATEIEDGTFELIAVSTLKPRQIVGGKFGSALLQAMIYFSALSPCIAFTYLLRGVDAVTIGLLLGVTLVTSASLCVTGLFLATVTRSKAWQLVMSVGLVIGLFICFMYLCVGVSVMLEENPTMLYDEPEFWASISAGVSILVSYAILFFCAATARITFPSENRSTRLRWIMLGQQALMVGWTMYVIIAANNSSFLVILCLVGAVHWMVMGAMMIGESDQLTHRMRRTLPQTALGRALVGYLTPGPHTGYQFAVLNVLSLAVFATLAVLICRRFGILPEYLRMTDLIWCGFVLTGYVAMYLGISRLVVSGLARFTTTGPFLGLLITVMIVLMGTLVPMLIQISLEDVYGDEYTDVQFSNPFWTMAMTFDSPAMQTSVTVFRVRLIVVSLGVVMFLINMILAVPHFRMEREQAPERVREEDAELARRSAHSHGEKPAGAHPLDE